MPTTIQISNELQKELTNRKLHDGETYEDVIWDTLEDAKELSEETIRDMEESRNEIKAGKFHTFEDVKKELRL